MASAPCALSRVLADIDPNAHLVGVRGIRPLYSRVRFRWPVSNCAADIVSRSRRRPPSLYCRHDRVRRYSAAIRLRRFASYMSTSLLIETRGDCRSRRVHRKSMGRRALGVAAKPAAARREAPARGRKGAHRARRQYRAPSGIARLLRRAVGVSRKARPER